MRRKSSIGLKLSDSEQLEGKFNIRGSVSPLLKNSFSRKESTKSEAIEQHKRDKECGSPTRRLKENTK